MKELKNILSENFLVEGDCLPEFFEAIKEFDEHIKYIPIGTEYTFFSPATVTESPSFYNEESDSLFFCSRGKEGRRALYEMPLEKIKSNLSPEMVEEIKGTRDILLKKKAGDLLVTPEAFQEAAKLVQLSGTALTVRSKFRDDYISSLLYDRIAIAERKKKTGVMAIALEEGGVQRVVHFASGGFTKIPQIVLEEVFTALSTKDDWGTIICRKWHIDQHWSYADIEFPDLRNSLREVYPDMPFNYIPGIRISTGSTGQNVLQVSATWRNEDAEFPIVVSETKQKHCSTYHMSSFIEEAHQNTWELYGALPERLADLFCSPFTGRDIETFVEQIYKELGLNKVFKQNDDDSPKREKSNYKKLITDLVLMQISYLENPTMYDVAISIMDAHLYIKFPDSYIEEVKTVLMKAPFCKAFEA